MTDEAGQDQGKAVRRHSVSTERHCSLRVVAFEDRQCIDRNVKIVDLSIVGIGVECDQPIEPGIVWFKECVNGQKCGLLVWRRQENDRYRVGIEFLSLSRLEEEYLRRQLGQAEHGKSVQDPEQLISRMINNIKKEMLSVV